MATTNNPTRLSERHHLMALMLLAGYRQCDVATALGYTENRVSILANSPLFKAQMADLRQQLRDSTIADAMTLIEREAGNSVRVLVDIRDTAAGPSADNVRRLAANDLLDRHPAFGRHAKTETEHVLRIAFSAADVRQMQAALPTPQAPTSPEVESSASDAPTLRTLDEALAACEPLP